MPRVAVPPSADLARLLRRRRQELKMTLRDAEARTRALGKVIPFSTLGKVEQGRVDPGVVRFQQLLQIYDIPPALALDLVAVEHVRGDIPQGARPQALFDEAQRRWNRGEIPRALGTMYALRKAVEGLPHRTELRQRAQLQFADAVSGLGRYNLSKYLIEQLMREPLPAGLLLRCLVRLAVCWERLGVQELALAVMTRAEALAADATPQEAAWLAHHRGLIDLARGTVSDAFAHLEGARRLHESAGDAQGALEAGLGMTRALVAGGRTAEAQRMAEGLLAATRSPSLRCFRTQAAVLLGHTQLAGGRVAQAVDTLRTALSEAVVEDNPSTRFLAHHYLAQAYAAAGDRERAGAEEHSAQQFRRYVDFTPDPIIREGRAPARKRRPRQRS